MTAISDLTNEQLDKLIAEKKGWIHKHCEVCGGWHWWIDADTFVNDVQFTTDPRYAMELAKEMQEKGYHVRIVLNPVSMRTYVELESATARIKTIIADTPERAIAEAWYQWKGEK